MKSESSQNKHGETEDSQAYRTAPTTNQQPATVIPPINQGTALRAPEITQSSIVNTAVEKASVRLKHGGQDASAQAHQAKKSSVTTEGFRKDSSMTPQSSRKAGSESFQKVEKTKPQRGSSGQFMQFADRLIGAINSNIGQDAQVNSAMTEANGYNIVSSKSHKMLPISKPQDKLAQQSQAQNYVMSSAGGLAQGKYISEQKTNLDKERMRISQSFKSILQREQARDEQLATRLKKINEKQTARIKEIETREQRNQQDELERLAQNSTFSELRPTQSQKILEPIASQHGGSGSQYSTIQPDAQAIINGAPELPTAVTQRQGFTSSIEKDEIIDKRYASTKKDYFNSKKNNFKIKPEKELRNNNNSMTVNNRNENAINNMVQGALMRGVGNPSQSVFSSWGGVNASKMNQVVNKDRPDVSYLQSKKNKMIIAKNSLFDSNVAMMSQSQLTSGNEGMDDYMQVALSLRHIGKSIMEMPKTLDDLRVLSREYMRNIGVTENIEDEQAYLQYIEDHLKAQEKASVHGDMSRKNNALSPIRNLADFYQRKLNKISSANETQQRFGSTSRSPTHHARGAKTGANQTSAQNAPSVNQTYIDMDSMTAADMDRLEKSPPKINPARKNMSVLNNKAMVMFGSEAFGVEIDQVDEETSATRLKTQRSSLLKSPMPVRDSQKEAANHNASPTKDTTPRTLHQKKSMLKSSTQREAGSIGLKKEDRATNRKKLLQSLNDLADQLTTPSIAQKDQKPEWLQKNLKEEAAKMGLSQANLGKPSSRQDAVLLAKWFKGTIDMIEDEYTTSMTYQAKQGMKRTFPTQKTHDGEVSQTDQYLLIQIAHNIAIKEMTRQVSVQCIERGILLKTIFDSYVRMVDLIFVDSVAQRKALAHKFAKVCEKQVYFQAEQIRKKDAVIDKKDLEIAQLKVQLAQAAERENALIFTNKKLGKITHRATVQAQEYQRQNTALERQIQFLETRIKILLDALDPEKAALFQKETRRALHKIQNQTDKEHASQLATKGMNAGNEELYEALGEIVTTKEISTDMFDHKLFLEELNGGPLEFENQMQTSLYMDEVENSAFDLYEVGAIEDKETMIDPEWRRESRPKRVRPKSATEKHDKRLEMLDDVSFDTSSHHTIDYILEDETSKSYTFGKNGGYQHLKRQRPIKRSLSAGNFNWNLLVDRINNKFDEEARLYAEKNANSAMAKLIEILGQELLDRIKNEYPELYEALMEYIRNKKGLVTFAFLKELLAKYNLNLEEERRRQRLQFADQFNSQNSQNLNESNEGISANDDQAMNRTNMTEMLNLDGNKNTIKDFDKNKVTMRNKKKDHMYQFVEWNFQKRRAAKKKPQERLRKDHPSFPIITKLMDRFNSGKEIKELMAVKSSVRYIYNVYMGKAAEYANEKQAQKKQSKERGSVSPEKNQGKDTKAELTKRESMVELKRTTTSQSPPADKTKKNTIGSPKESQAQPAKFQRLNSSLSGKGSEKNEEIKGGKKDASSKSPTKGQDLATNVNLIEWTYEYFQNRYGLKNVADKKFNQFIGSVLKYKQKHPRFRLFGRFLGLYDELTEQDLKLYVDIVHNMFKSVLNFQIQEQDEVVYIPTARACDYFRLTFAARLTNTSMTHCLKIIRQKQVSVSKALQEKYLHLNSYTEAVQLDDFAEFVIHTTNQLQAEKLQNIYEIFMAADLNNNNILEFNELKTLYKLLCNQSSGDRNQQMTEIRNLFNEYSKAYTNIKGAEGIRVRGISYESFEKLCLDRDVFTIRQQNSFINAATKSFLNVTDNHETFSTEFESLSRNLENIYQRLSDAIRDLMDSDVVPETEKERYQDMVEQMAKAVMNPVNKKVAFLTFKIVEETIKRVCLKNDIEELMPVLPECIASMKKSLGAGSASVGQPNQSVNEKGMKNSLNENLKVVMAGKAMSFLQTSSKDNSELGMTRMQESESQSQFDNQARQSRQSRFRGNSDVHTMQIEDGRNPDMLEHPAASFAANSAETKNEVGNTATQSFVPNQQQNIGSKSEEN